MLDSSATILSFLFASKERIILLLLIVATGDKLHLTTALRALRILTNRNTGVLSRYVCASRSPVVAASLVALLDIQAASNQFLNRDITEPGQRSQRRTIQIRPRRLANIVFQSSALSSVVFEERIIGRPNTFQRLLVFSGEPAFRVPGYNVSKAPVIRNDLLELAQVEYRNPP